MGFRRARCAHCKSKFEPERAGQIVHVECVEAWTLAKAAKRERAAAKVERKETRQAKEKMKTRSDWMREAQAAVNAYVRERDKDLPCISCGRHHQGQYHAGHYLSRGAHPELALEPINLAKQCAPCNVHLSGNQVKYRAGLIQRVGLEIVEWLEGPHPQRKYTVDDLKAIKALYREKLCELKKSCSD